MFTAAIWAAVSTKSQADDDKVSIEHQVTTCRQMVQKNGWQEQACLVVPGHTRDILFLQEAANEIPQMAELLQLAQRREVDLVVAWHPNRLYRNEALGAQLREYLGVCGTQMTFVESPMPLVAPGEFDYRTNMAARAASLVFSFASASEMSNLRAKSLAGKRHSAERGKYLGSIPPYGYHKTAPGIIEVDEAEAEVFRKILKWYLEEGMGVHAIARRLNTMGITNRGKPWWVSTIWKMLQNPTYYGLIRFGYDKVIRVPTRNSDVRLVKKRVKDPDCILVEGQHEAIASRSDYRWVQETITRRRATRGMSPRAQYLLTGVARCPLCGGPLSGKTERTPKKTYRYYKCRNGANLPSPDQCAFTAVRADEAERDTLALVRDIMERPDLYDEAVSQFLRTTNSADRIRQLEAALAALQKKKRRLDEAYLGEAMSLSSYRDLNTEVEAEIAGAEASLRELETQSAVVDERQKLVAQLREFFASGKSLLDVMSRHQVRNLIQSFFESIVLSKEGIVSWKLRE